jgi:hypothetical protein
MRALNFLLLKSAKTIAEGESNRSVIIFASLTVQQQHKEKNDFQKSVNLQLALHSMRICCCDCGLSPSVMTKHMNCTKVGDVLITLWVISCNALAFAQCFANA